MPGVIPAGTESDVLFNGTDILPTVCGVVGAKVPANRNVDGVDAFSAFLDKEVRRKDSAIWFFPHHGDTWFRMPQISMRKVNCSLIAWLPNRPEGVSLDEWLATSDPDRVELYDVSVDPAQSNDIAREHPETVRSMKKEMTTLWREMRDEGLQNQQIADCESGTSSSVLITVSLQRIVTEAVFRHRVPCSIGTSEQGNRGLSILT